MNAQLHYQPSAAHLITGGYEFENENYAFDFTDASDPGAASGVNATQKSNALFVQDQTRWFGGRLLVTGGFRAQYFSLDRPALLPLASAPYQGVAINSPPAAYTGDGSVAYFFRGTQHQAARACGARLSRAFALRTLRVGVRFVLRIFHLWRSAARAGAFDQLSMPASIRPSRKGTCARRPLTFYTSLQQMIAFATLTGTDPFGRFFGYYNSQGGISRGVETKVSMAPRGGVEFFGQLHFRKCGGAESVDRRHSAHAGDSAPSVFRRRRPGAPGNGCC